MRSRSGAVGIEMPFFSVGTGHVLCALQTATAHRLACAMRVCVCVPMLCCLCSVICKYTDFWPAVFGCYTDHCCLPACALLPAAYAHSYSSSLALSARVSAAVAEQLYGRYGGEGGDCWRGAWRAASGLPVAVADAGCSREVSRKQIPSTI